MQECDVIVVSIPCKYSGSLRLTHGSRMGFLLSEGADLGAVKAVTLRWEYDHEIDPLNLTKVKDNLFAILQLTTPTNISLLFQVCVFGLCSDHLFLRNVTVRSLQTNKSNRRPSSGSR